MGGLGALVEKYVGKRHVVLAVEILESVRRWYEVWIQSIALWAAGGY